MFLDASEDLLLWLPAARQRCPTTVAPSLLLLGDICSCVPVCVLSCRQSYHDIL